MKKLLFIGLIAGVLTSQLFGQSAYLDKGDSGLGFNGAYTSTDNTTGYSLAAGYSFSGILDLGFSLNRTGFDQQLFGADLNATTISPAVSYFLLKQDEFESMPLSLSLDASYQRQFYTNDVLDENDITMSGNFFTLGSSLYRDFRLSDQIKIQPALGYTYITGSTKLEDGQGNTSSEDDNTSVFSVGASVIFNSSPTGVFAVMPVVGFQEETTSVGISLSYIIKQ